ncbi:MULTISPECIES: hypothetical protein [Alphaproteobacteria]|uniref:YciI family protein n=1 Tax=Alphaproteobacteria TaxID=28211 RepID=UPI0032644374
MFIVTLTLTEKKSKAPEFMEAHKAWIAKGFDDGIFVLVGSLKPQGGGVILAIGSDHASIEARINEDPFVVEGIATPHIQEVSPGRVAPELSVLSDGAQ